MMDIFEPVSMALDNIIAVLLIIFYLVQCLFGYRFLKASCSILGFIIGLILGYSLSVSLLNASGYWPAIVGVLCGLILGGLAFKLYRCGLFLLGFGFTFFTVSELPLPDTSVWTVVRFVGALVLGILVGVLCVKFSKTLVICVTAIGGAVNAVSGLREISAFPSFTDLSWLLLMAALACIGLLLQLLTNRSKR